VSLDDLDVRYGRRPSGDRRRLLIVALAGFGVLALVWAVWAGLVVARSSMEWRATAVDTADPSAVRVAVEVTQDPGRPALCTVRATAADGEVVGWVDLAVPASASRTATATATIRTVRAADDGTVVTCVRR
jgi:hypothetical protein